MSPVLASSPFASSDRDPFLPFPSSRLIPREILRYRLISQEVMSRLMDPHGHAAGSCDSTSRKSSRNSQDGHR